MFAYCDTKCDFSITAKCDFDFVEKLMLAAWFLEESTSNIFDYMDGYSKRAWNLGYVIRSTNPSDFVTDLVKSGLFSKERIQ